MNFVKVTREEINADRKDKHDDRPELRRRKQAAEEIGAAIVAADKLNGKAEDRVCRQIHTEIVTEMLFQQEIGQNAEQNEEKRRFVKLRGVNGVRQVRKFHAEKRIGFFTVTASGRSRAPP